MTREDIRAIVVEELKRVAPELDPAGLDPDALVRDQVEMDSLDLLNFLTAIHRRLGVDVPERDYGELATLARTEAYLAGRLAAVRPGAKGDPS